MTSKYFVTEGVVIKRFNYGEADRILTIFSPDKGKFSALAKAVRKPSSRKRGDVELFNHIKCQCVNSRSGLHLLTETTTITPYAENLYSGLYVTQVANSSEATNFELRDQEKFETITLAFELAKLIDTFLREEEGHLEVFDLLCQSLQAISQPEADLRTISIYFKQRLIRLLGFWPCEHNSPDDIDQFIAGLL